MLRSLLWLAAVLRQDNWKKNTKQCQKIVKKTQERSKNCQKASKKWKKGPCGQQKAPAGNKNTKNSEIIGNKQKKTNILNKKNGKKREKNK